MAASSFAEKRDWEAMSRFRKSSAIAIIAFLVLNYAIIVFVSLTVYGESGPLKAIADSLFHYSDFTAMLLPNQLLFLAEVAALPAGAALAILGLATAALAALIYVGIVRRGWSPLWVVLAYVLASAVTSFVTYRYLLFT